MLDLRHHPKGKWQKALNCIGKGNTVGLGAPSQKTSLLGRVAQILIYPRPSLRLADVGLFVRPKSQQSPSNKESPLQAQLSSVKIKCSMWDYLFDQIPTIPLDQRVSPASSTIFTLEDQMLYRDHIFTAWREGTPYVKHQLQSVTPLHRVRSCTPIAKEHHCQISREPTNSNCFTGAHYYAFLRLIRGSTTSHITHTHD